MSTLTIEPLLVDAQQLALMIGLSLRTIRRMDAAGRLPRPVRIGNCTRWRVSEIRAWSEAGCPDRAAWEQQRRAAHDN